MMIMISMRVIKTTNNNNKMINKINNNNSDNRNGKNINLIISYHER